MDIVTMEMTMNLATPRTLEFAVKNAMERLGVGEVASILGVSIDTLYKGTNPNSGRTLPDLPISKFLALAGAMNAIPQNGVPNYFAELFNRAVRIEPVAVCPFEKMTEATAVVGKVASVLGDIHHPGSHGGRRVTREEAAVLHATVEEAKASLELVEHAVRH